MASHTALLFLLFMGLEQPHAGVDRCTRTCICTFPNAPILPQIATQNDIYAHRETYAVSRGDLL